MKRIGVLGGTFDPVHIAHLVVAEEARVRLSLEVVYFVPAGQPWHKGGRPISPAEHRLAMLDMALRSNPHFKLSLVDIRRAGPSYTVDTIPDLRRELAEEVEFYFLVGMDSVATLPTWREPDRLLDSCRLVGLRRPGYGRFDLRTLDGVISQASQRIMVLDVPQMDVSSSDIRARVAAGLPIRYLVPPGVGEYIDSHGLYKEPNAA